MFERDPWKGLSKVKTFQNGESGQQRKISDLPVPKFWKVWRGFLQSFANSLALIGSVET